MQKENDEEITLGQVCKYFNVEDVYELSKLNLKHDQKAIKEANFDESDPHLLNNKIKEKLQKVNLNILDKHERKVVQNILWLWYHHATTVAIWGKNNLPRARELCRTALKYQYATHPNKITPMIYMLLDGKIDDARKWNEAEVKEVEKEYALHLLDEYKKGIFNDKSPSHKTTGI